MPVFQKFTDLVRWLVTWATETFPPMYQAILDAIQTIAGYDSSAQQSAQQAANSAQESANHAQSSADSAQESAESALEAKIYRDETEELTLTQATPTQLGVVYSATQVDVTSGTQGKMIDAEQMQSEFARKLNDATTEQKGLVTLATFNEISNREGKGVVTADNVVAIIAQVSGGDNETIGVTRGTSNPVSGGDGTLEYEVIEYSDGTLVYEAFGQVDADGTVPVRIQFPTAATLDPVTNKPLVSPLVNLVSDASDAFGTVYAVNEGYFEVAAINSADDSLTTGTLSVQAKARLEEGLLPPRPSNAQIQSPQTGHVIGTCDPVSGASLYTIYSADTPTGAQAQLGTATQPLVNVTGIAAGTKYYFISATNEYGEGRKAGAIQGVVVDAGATITSVNGIGRVIINMPQVVGADTYTLEGSANGSTWQEVNSSSDIVYTVVDEADMFKYWRYNGSYGGVSFGDVSPTFEYTPVEVSDIGLTVTDLNNGNLEFTYSGGTGALQVMLYTSSGGEVGEMSLSTKKLTIPAPVTPFIYYAVARAGFSSKRSSNVTYNAYVPVRNLTASFNSSTKKIDISWQAPYNSACTGYHVYWGIWGQSFIGPIVLDKNVLSTSVSPTVTGTYRVHVYALYPSDNISIVQETANINVVLSSLISTVTHVGTRAAGGSFVQENVTIPTNAKWCRYRLIGAGAGSGAYSQDTARGGAGGGRNYYGTNSYDTRIFYPTQTGLSSSINIINLTRGFSAADTDTDGDYTAYASSGGGGGQGSSGLSNSGGGTGVGGIKQGVGGGAGAFTATSDYSHTYTRRIATSTDGYGLGGVPTGSPRGGTGGNGAVVEGQFTVNPSTLSTLQVFLAPAGWCGQVTESVSARAGNASYCQLEFWTDVPQGTMASSPSYTTPTVPTPPTTETISVTYSYESNMDSRITFAAPLAKDDKMLIEISGSIIQDNIDSVDTAHHRTIAGMELYYEGGATARKVYFALPNTELNRGVYNHISFSKTLTAPYDIGSIRIGNFMKEVYLALWETVRIKIQGTVTFKFTRLQ